MLSSNDISFKNQGTGNIDGSVQGTNYTDNAGSKKNEITVKKKTACDDRHTPNAIPLSIGEAIEIKPDPSDNELIHTTTTSNSGNSSPYTAFAPIVYGIVVCGLIVFCYFWKRSLFNPHDNFFGNYNGQ